MKKYIVSLLAIIFILAISPTKSIAYKYKTICFDNSGTKTSDSGVWDCIEGGTCLQFGNYSGNLAGNGYCDNAFNIKSGATCCVNDNPPPTPTPTLYPTPTPLPSCSSVNGTCYISQSDCQSPNYINLSYTCSVSGRVAYYCCVSSSVPTPTSIPTPTSVPSCSTESSQQVCVGQSYSYSCQKYTQTNGGGYLYDEDTTGDQICRDRYKDSKYVCCTISVPSPTPSNSNSGAGSIAGNPPTTLPTIVCTTLNGQQCDGIQTGVGFMNTDAAKFINSIFTIILSLSGGIALILIIVSGYQLSLSSANPEKVKEAQGMLTAAIIGFVFILFSVAILQIIGVDILGSILPTFGK